jgi:hypothetical protein
MVERHSHKRFWLAIVVLAIVAITFLVRTAWLASELDGTQGSLLLLESELGATQSLLADVETELGAAQAELALGELELSALEAELRSLQVNYERLTTGYGYLLRDPSYQEMKDFLEKDKTSEREYVQNGYICVDFAADVKANAAKEGLRCAYVVIEYLGTTGHAIVAFDTTDQGLVFVEPQFDWEVEPEIGWRYYQCVKPPPGYYMNKPPYDDTIARFVVIW